MEKRGLYEGDQYGAQEAEKRTVHLGIDLFVEGNEENGGEIEELVTNFQHPCTNRGK